MAADTGKSSFGRVVSNKHYVQTISLSLILALSDSNIKHKFQKSLISSLPDCMYGSLPLADGETVPDPDDPCQTCQCLRGSVRCRSVTCPPVTCSNPSQDGCCPVCAECQFRGRRYRNGEVITDEER